MIDEAAQISDETWTSVLRPTLTDTEGKMMAISTPNGRNWFYQAYQRGVSTDHSDYEGFQYPTASNPHITTSEIEDVRSELSEREFRREYNAEFVDNSAAVFKGVRERNVSDYEADEATPPYTIGVDFGRTDSYTVIIALDDTGTLVAFERLRDVGWPQVQDTVERVYDTYPGRCCVDATRDNKIVTDLEDAGVPVDPIEFTAKNKRTLIENLATRLERETITLPDLPPLVSELEQYESETTPTGNVRYKAPPGAHDDCVDALALAVYRDRERLRKRRGAEVARARPILGTVKGGLFQ